MVGRWFLKSKKQNIRILEYVKHPFFPIFVFILLIFAKIYIYNYEVSGPTIFGDEYLYIRIARRLLNNKFINSVQYPPLYSILLLPAIISKNNWYEFSIYLNIIFSSLVIFPAWLISKKMLSKIGILVTSILISLLPFHIAYPGYIMSENLFVSINLLAIYLFLVSYKKSFNKRFIFGVILGLCYLTKYLFLPSIIIFLLIWSIRIIFIDHKRIKIQKRIIILINKLSPVFIGLIIVYAPWVVYSYAFSGFSITKSLGFGSTGIKAINDINLNSLLMWLSAYVAYYSFSIFYSLSIIISLILLIILKRIKLKEPDITFISTILSLSICYILLATQHSWGAKYNYPEVRYILGRYLIHMSPLLVIFSIFSYEKLLNFKNNTNFILFFSIIIGVVLITFSNQILFNKLFFNLPPYFAQSVFNSTDSYFFYLTSINYLLLISIFPILLLYFRSKKNKKMVLSLAFLPYIFIQLSIQPRFIKIMNETRQWGIHGKHIKLVAENIIKNRNNEINFYTDDFYFFYDKNHIKYSLLSWNFNKNDLKYLNFDNKLINENPSLLVSKLRYPVKLETSYMYNDIQINIYYFDHNDLEILTPKIIDFFPKFVSGDEIFNKLVDGNSAMWLITQHTTENTVVSFNNSIINPTFGDNGEITISIDPQLYINQDQIEITLCDKILDLCSDPVFLKITK